MTRPKSTLKPKVASKVILDNISLYCFNEHNTLRLWAKRVVEYQYFEMTIFCIIALNSLILMLEEPALVDPYTKSAINYLNKAINALYCLEATLKIIAMGFVVHKNSYLRDPFNIFDFIIILVSIASMIIED
jgi:voltage-dependent calcium channel L type alpha-1D